MNSEYLKFLRNLFAYGFLLNIKGSTILYITCSLKREELSFSVVLLFIDKWDVIGLIINELNLFPRGQLCDKSHRPIEENDGTCMVCKIVGI